MTTIQLRRDILTNWTTKNPVLAAGEVGLITDSTKGEYKIGNGSDDWKTLPMFSGKGGDGGLGIKDDNTVIGPNYESLTPEEKEIIKGEVFNLTQDISLNGKIQTANKATGVFSHAEGNHTKSTGFASHAEGSTTIATGNSSHAEGNSSQASEDDSHAEGNQTKATGFASHAEGISTTASYRGSHAEGYKTIANGEYSHAEGNNTQSKGNYSHAEGNKTQATEQSSHSEGEDSQAIGNYSHAEGLQTKSTGNSSHAEGLQSKSTGIASHAEGDNTQTTNIAEHAEGKYNKSNQNVAGGNTISSTGIGYAEERRKNAVEVLDNGLMFVHGVGTYNGTNPLETNSLQKVISDKADKSAITDMATKTWVNDEKFLKSIPAEYITETELTGKNYATTAQLDSKLNTSVYTEDKKTFATKGELGKKQDILKSGTSIKTVNQETILGAGDIKTVGKYGTAKCSEVFNDLLGNSANGQYSHVEGGNNIAQGNLSHAEGNHTKSTGIASHAEGGKAGEIPGITEAVGNLSHAEGEVTTSIGTSSHSEGGKTESYGNYSHVEGLSNKTLTDNSHSEGTSCYSGGWICVAAGGCTIDKEVYQKGDLFYPEKHTPERFKELIGTILKDPQKFKLTGTNGHSEGEGSQAIGDSSHSEGLYTKAIGWCSHVEGGYNSAIGDFSHAEGGMDDNAEECCNRAIGNYSHAEGVGTTATGEGSHAEGWSSKTNGNYSHAEGVDTIATGDYSHVEGSTSNAIGDNSHAEGYTTKSNGVSSHAEGDSTESVGVASHAGGGFSRSIGDYSFAMGNTTISDNQSQVAIGEFNTREPVPSSVSYDISKTTFSIGNGTGDSTRSDAVKILGDGTTWINGIGSFTGTNAAPENSLQTILSSCVSSIPANLPVNEVTGYTNLVADIEKLKKEKLNKKTVIRPGAGSGAMSIFPEKYYIWGEVTELRINLVPTENLSDEYQFEFRSGSTPTRLLLPSTVKWINGTPILIEKNKTYVISIINNFAVGGAFY